MKLRALCLLLLLAACSGRSEKAPQPSPTPTVAAPKTLVAADFDPTAIGAKIDMQRGGDLEGGITAEGKTIGSVLAYVACPQDTTECIPANMPAGTIYTYVITVKPNPPALGTNAAMPPVGGGPAGPQATGQAPPIIFRTTEKANGFTGGVGYSRDQALDALGSEDAITVTVDSDRLIWRVTDGSGWMPGMPITFWWQSTVPPEGYRKAYGLELAGLSATVDAPSPNRRTRYRPGDRYPYGNRGSHAGDGLSAARAGVE